MRKLISVNLLTATRLLSVPVVMYSTSQRNWTVAAPVLLLGVITDLFDGWLARRWDVVSDFGSSFDKHSDRLLLVSPILGMLIGHELNWLIAAIAVIAVWIQDYSERWLTHAYVLWWRPACYLLIAWGFIQTASTTLMFLIGLLCGVVVSMAAVVKKGSVRHRLIPSRSQSTTGV